MIHLFDIQKTLFNDQLFSFLLIDSGKNAKTNIKLKKAKAEATKKGSWWFIEDNIPPIAGPNINPAATDAPSLLIPLILFS